MSVDAQVLINLLGKTVQYLITYHGTEEWLYLYQKQAKYDKVESLFERALAIREKVLGSEHPDTALSLNSLAHLYYSQAKYDKAGSLFEWSLEIREKVLGSAPRYGIISEQLGCNLQQAGQLSSTGGRKPEALYKRVLVIYEKVLGSEHPDIVSSTSGRKAEVLYKRVLEICDKVKGLEHRDTALSLSTLAYLHRLQGKYAKVDALYERALVIREKVWELEHPDMASSLKFLPGLRWERLANRILLYCDILLDIIFFSLPYKPEMNDYLVLT
ncbi:hypothetical protein BC938DRAFT_480594 [Jimgerdemannia flammicorona]|uniref:Tetratricopeptide repeat-domain-containing protein n=1 Tax=Jimgerdemannia flammicorona TaxID=994334 RepID=A0A433QI70_9FUNG|nr:hypothetical protein BC938DRAFT_480594 [Jimgerdemannia flammicorona]